VDGKVCIEDERNEWDSFVMYNQAEATRSGRERKEMHTQLMSFFVCVEKGVAPTPSKLEGSWR
jgi:hypothetical protein